MAGSPMDAADAAIERLRGLRPLARQRRERVAEAVRQVRARNHEESVQAMLRARAASRPAQPWPANRPARHLHLFDSDDVEPPAEQSQPGQQPPTRQPPAAHRPGHVDDDDWSNETWLH